MLIWFEIKKYLLSYRQFLFWLIAAAATCFILYKGAVMLLERESFFEPFSIGIVGGGGSPEIQYIFDFLDNIVSLEYFEKDEADTLLNQSMIPAYVELPDAFAADIMRGANAPFKFYGNQSLPLQLALSKLLASGGIAFLSGSQAGIYATLDFAADHGLDRNFINTYILLPINVAFVKRMMDYDSIFITKNIPVTGSGNPIVLFCVTFTAFMCMTGLLSYVKNLRSYTPDVYARYKIAGQPLIKIMAIRYVGLFLVYGMVIILLCAVSAALFGWIGLLDAVFKGFAFSACVCAFGIFSASVFKNDSACGLFIFTAALCMFFLSGGVVPLAFIPGELHALRFASFPFWAAENGKYGNIVLLVFAFILFGVAVIIEFFYTRFLRKV